MPHLGPSVSGLGIGHDEMGHEEGEVPRVIIDVVGHMLVACLWEEVDVLTHTIALQHFFVT